MLKTKATTSASSSSSTNGNKYSIVNNSGNLSLNTSGWSASSISNTTSPYLIVNTPYTNPLTTQFWQTINNPTAKLPETIPRILAYRGGNDEISDVEKINSIYCYLIMNLSNTTTEIEKTIEKYKKLWEISKCNEAIWTLFCRDDDTDVSKIANYLILHCH
jgi:hypothetical protein